ncbi:amidase [Sulfitobacter sp. S190]|uniref:amidase n=1 Tax=Sulfitobacter sp. S190 TaxID=2867022 RepID=UPI0021A75707|nr:amidase [Sulfitobacter sp. S190]UWR20949.1 amidase [Sulfitobacter sp. S190]
MDILDLDAHAQADALARRQFSAHDLMQATLARIDAINPVVNAIVSLQDPDALLAQARAADAAEREGWLHGIPIAIKDLANAAGLPTSQGSPLFAGQIAQSDDLMVARLRAAGAIVIGKTNTPEFGLGSHTYNPVHGRTRNPFDPSRSAGGSSGGAAAALATRMLSVADGSDMMGSLRNPAGWNNVYGMRPSWGTVPPSPEGDMFLHQLSTAGPMARSPTDLAMLLDTMTGPDPRLPLCQHSHACAPTIAEDPGALRIGWAGDWGGAFAVEEGIMTFSENALRQLESMGHHVAALKAPFDADAMWQSWCDLRSFAVAGGLADIYDDPARRDALKEAAQWEVGRGVALGARQIQQASEIRSDWMRAATALFQKIDVMVLPSAQLWPLDGTLDFPKRIAGRAMDTYHRWMQVVIPASLIGLPVVNIPCGFNDDGLPGGLQLIGPRGSNARLLQLAQQWHVETLWPQTRPPEV